MSELTRILGRIERTDDCEVTRPCGQPVLRAADRLPGDLVELYELCGGLSLFDHGTYPIRIVAPAEFVRSNPAIVGEDVPDDISDTWYVVARGGNEEAISIDCSPDRLGRCYDSFWDRHGVAGSCPIVALSITELLQRLWGSAGGHRYWLAGDGVGYGDAYDGGRG